MTRPSPALAVAALALFVSLGGSSFAAVQLARNSVLSKHIKDGQVRRADLALNAIGTAQVADGSLLAGDFKPGQLPAGPKGDPGVEALTVRAEVGMGAVTAHCLPGERATGGGAHSLTGLLTGSAPVSEPTALFTDNPPVAGYTPTAWSGHATSELGYDAKVTVWVVCARP